MSSFPHNGLSDSDSETSVVIVRVWHPYMQDDCVLAIHVPGPGSASAIRVAEAVKELSDANDSKGWHEVSAQYLRTMDTILSIMSIPQLNALRKKGVRPSPSAADLSGPDREAVARSAVRSVCQPMLDAKPGGPKRQGALTAAVSLLMLLKDLWVAGLISRAAIDQAAYDEMNDLMLRKCLLIQVMQEGVNPDGH